MKQVMNAKGQAELTINGMTTILHGTFENTKLFEESSGYGIYEVLDLLQSGKVRHNHLVEIIWCFTYERDTKGWTKEEIHKRLFAANMDQVRELVLLWALMMWSQGADDASELQEEKKT